jgi:TonB family protein
MPVSRPISAFLVLTAISAIAQQTASPPPTAKAPATQSDAAPTPDKPLHIGGNVKKPVAIHVVEPQFGETGTVTKLSGKVHLYLWVEKNGTPSHIRVIDGTGTGLDEKAVEAVRQYRFKPATLNGQPVIVDLYIDVNFQVMY